MDLAVHWNVSRPTCTCSWNFCDDPSAMRFYAAACRYVDVLDVYGYTPLHHGAAEKKLDAVATLLAHGANLICRTWYPSGFYPQ